MEYTDPERFKIAQKDWATLSKKHRACTHYWVYRDHNIAKDHTVWECQKCGVWFNKRRLGPPLPHRSVEPTFNTPAGSALEKNSGDASA